MWRERLLLTALASVLMLLLLFAFFAARSFGIASFGTPPLTVQTPSALAAQALPEPAGGAFPVFAVVDLAGTATLAPAETFPDAKGPPLNLLAPVEKRDAARAVLAAAVPTVTIPVAAPASVPAADTDEVPEGPVLTETEQLIVDMNAERRAARLALARLVEHSESGGARLSAAVMVQPLLRRAEQEAAQLDRYGDALLLSEGTVMKQAALAGFHASRAALLTDIARAESILG